MSGSESTSRAAIGRRRHRPALRTSTALLLSALVHATALPAWLVAVTSEGEPREPPAPVAVQTVLVRFHAPVEPTPRAEPTSPPRLEPPTEEFPDPVLHELPVESEPEHADRTRRAEPTWDTPTPLVEVRARPHRPAVPPTETPIAAAIDDARLPVDAPPLPVEEHETEQVTVIAPLPGTDNPPPHYPSVARRRGWEGLVILLVGVDAGGVVLEVTVQVSSGHPVLDRAALAAVERWRFAPATRNDEPIPGETTVAIRFELED